MVAVRDPAEIEAQRQRDGSENDGYSVGADSYAQQYQDVQHGQRGETRFSARDGWHVGGMTSKSAGGFR